MMMTVNWNMPIVTNTGKPARWRWHGRDGDRWVRGDFGGGVAGCYVDAAGRLATASGGLVHIRNATPAEILAHPDIWPEWQDEARKMQMKADVAVVARPDGVFVTRAMLRQAVADCCAHGKGSGIEEVADALGIPPDPPKQAPWEAAMSAAYPQAWNCAEFRDGARCAVEWVLAEAMSVSGIKPGPRAEIRNRIMGGKHD